MRYIPGIGPSNARLAVIGEAPGGEEERLGYPFAGATGKMVDDMLASEGSNRNEVYLTNIVKVRPPNNDINQLKLIGRNIDEFMPQLWQELDSLKPNAVLALGNTALTALTGMRGIQKYRGSILQSLRGLPKVISTIHPASILHKENEGMASWKDLTYIRWDFKRAIQEARSSDMDLPRRNIIIARSSLDFIRFIERQRTRHCAVDIETFKTIPQCISFAFSSSEAISVPLFNLMSEENPTGLSRNETCHLWRLVSEILYDHHYLKIGQNFKFDQGLLKRAVNRTVSIGLSVRSFYFDTNLAFRILYPELPSKLEFISSVLTREPYYKDEGKEYNPKKDRLDRWLAYNARDAVVTYECYEQEKAELEGVGLWDFFMSKTMPLHGFYSRMENRGLLRDEVVRKAHEKRYEAQHEELQTELEQVAGHRVNVNSNGLKGQVAQLLFKELNLPLRASTDNKTLSALMRNTIKDPLKKRAVEIVLEDRKVRKTIGTYIKAKAHPDGRVRTAIRIILETGRTATAVLKAPVIVPDLDGRVFIPEEETDGKGKPKKGDKKASMGLAFQTITKHGDIGADLREEYIPDPGYIFIEPDLSQAEARIVASLACDFRLLKFFQYKIDIHRFTAAQVDGSTPDELVEKFMLATDDSECWRLAKEINEYLKTRIGESQRQFGKKYRHAAHYDMGKREASMQSGASEWAAGRALDRIHEANSGIRNVFHKEIQEALRDNNRRLRTPHGRSRQFLNKWGDELFKEAYAYIPQATVSDHLKFAAMRIEHRLPYLRIHQESHDSFLGGIPDDKDCLDESLIVIQEELEVPIDMSLCSLPRESVTIPCEIKIGRKNWLEMERVL